MMMIIRLKSFGRTAYNLLFNKYLLITNTATSALLVSSAELAAQEIELTRKTRKERDWTKVARFSILGMIAGPLNHGWYWTLDRYLPGKTFSIIFKKILLDETIGSPIFAFVFFIGADLLNGIAFQPAWLNLKEKFWRVYKADLTIWPAAQIINFYIVPSKFRVAYVSVISFAWLTFLCYIQPSKPSVLKSLDK